MTSVGGLLAPQNAEAMHRMGLSAAGMGNSDAACVWIAAAIRHDASAARYYQSLAGVLYGQRKYRQAAACYRQGLVVSPDEELLQTGLMRALLGSGQPAEAAAVAAPFLHDHAQADEVWHLLGIALHQAGRFDDAAQALRRAIELCPNNANAHYDLGLAYTHLGDEERAEAAYRYALQAEPSFPEACNNLGNLLRRRGCAADAEACYRRALRLRPHFPEARYNLGLTLQSLDLLEQAETCYRDVLKQDPQLAAAHNNLGNTLLAMGSPARAIGHFGEAAGLKPDNREYLVNLGMAQLLTGDFRAGWQNYARREINSPPNIPLWDGSPLRGRRILLRSEQGFGDTIQFIRYARMLKELGAQVSNSCPSQLARLFDGHPAIDEMVDPDRPSRDYDCYAPLMHLPGILDTRLDTIPADVPYLVADPELVRFWGVSLGNAGGRRRIGIAWRGNPQHLNDGNRSIDPAVLGALAGVPNTRFISLQPEWSGGGFADSLPWQPLSRPLTDFADTAALMMNLELVISVDTAVAHLAGALARPVWALLPFAPDWRWMLARDDSPWYPTMRLFRQKRRGQWPEVIARVRDALR